MVYLHWEVNGYELGEQSVLGIQLHQAAPGIAIFWL